MSYIRVSRFPDLAMRVYSRPRLQSGIRRPQVTSCVEYSISTLFPLPLILALGFRVGRLHNIRGLRTSAKTKAAPSPRVGAVGMGGFRFCRGQAARASLALMALAPMSMPSRTASALSVVTISSTWGMPPRGADSADERLGVKNAAAYRLPEPDAMIGTTRGWLPETIDRWNAQRPGRGQKSGGRARDDDRRVRVPPLTQICRSAPRLHA